MVEPIAILLAAFFGAWFAFRLQDKAKVREERVSNINAANRALFTVFQQINSLRVFQFDIIDPVRNHPIKFIAMRPVLKEQYEYSQFDFPTLGFLLNSKQRQIVLDLFVEQQRFRSAIKVINYRSALYINEVEPALKHAGIREEYDYTKDELVEALGHPLNKSLQRATDQVIYTVDRTVNSLDEIKGKMIKAFKDLFPDGDFLNFELIEGPANKSLQGDGIKPPVSAQP
jgi:hypothetical protein